MASSGGGAAWYRLGSDRGAERKTSARPRRSERRGQDHVRSRVSRGRSRMPCVLKRRPHRCRPLSLQPGLSSHARRPPDAAADRRPCPPQSFAFETTLSDRGYARAIPKWRANGYAVSLWFLSLPSAEMAIARVARRVQQGGHAIPEDVVRRRFEAGRANLERIYKAAVDDWVIYDNSGPVPVLLDWSENR
jgi:hypothetical protein